MRTYLCLGKQTSNNFNGETKFWRKIAKISWTEKLRKNKLLFELSEMFYGKFATAALHMVWRIIAYHLEHYFGREGSPISEIVRIVTREILRYVIRVMPSEDRTGVVI